jgi:hypothetical protein
MDPVNWAPCLSQTSRMADAESNALMKVWEAVADTIET